TCRVEHPMTELLGRQLLQRHVEVHRHMPQSSELTAARPVSRTSVSWVVNEVVVYGKIRPPYPRCCRDCVALFWGLPHRLFDEHVDSGRQQLGRDARVELRRQQYVSRVDFSGGSKCLDMAKHLRDMPALREARGSLRLKINYRGNEHIRSFWQNCLMSLGNVTGTDKPNSPSRR